MSNEKIAGNYIRISKCTYTNKLATPCYAKRVNTKVTLAILNMANLIVC